ncbi:MFSD5 [Cordylochernes scorpioides]|uniref:Molybdate-anion transporter n=1 Tax=Cordylochernes scorpioides TaxID=51811 RepID=A0ABY6KCV8_9ARAC|nr:MFSD5 [Cordylochernes scorpioides]
MTQTLPLWKNGKEDEQLNNHVLSDVDIEEPAPDTMVNRQTESSESDRPQRTRTIPKRFDDYVLATTNETIPKDYEEAIACEDKKHWENAMLEEIQNMYSHQVWELVPRPVNAKVVKSKWVFKISKDQENKTYKARLVAMGYHQIPGRDYNESFSPVIKNATLRTILSMAATKDSVIKLFDVKAAYLNGNIENTIFMEQPAGFVQDRNKVCKLNKSIYGLPQSGRSWYEKFSQVLHDCGLEKLKSDPCLFKWKNEDKYFYVGIYVDDFITVSDSEDTSNRFINKLRHHLEIKDVTCKGMFLGIKIIQDKEGISLQQSHYVQQILQKYGLENCKEVPTPGSKEINLDNHIEDDNCDQHTYQEALGMLMFLAVNTRPDIAYITSKLSQYSRQPKQMHWTAIKRVMRYLRGTIDLGVKFERGKTGILKSYADASWSTTHDGKSYGGYVLKLGEATIDWKSSKQPLVALSTMEAEMIAACESCCQIKWIINLLRELEEWNFMEKPTAIYTDSQSLINWISSPKQSSRCRHINRKYHFLRDCYESRDICLLYKPSQDLEADIFTKDLSRDQMKKHLESLSIVGIKPKRDVLVTTTYHFLRFQRTYFLVYFLALFADWLQGPYVYKLYSHYGFAESQIASLYVVGFGASVVFGTATGALADRYGRKLLCIVFCILYSFCCLTKLSSDYFVLMLGRFLGGISTSLLFSAFESWYIYEHIQTHDFPKEWISVTFFKATYWNSILAIGAGVLANFTTEVLGWGPVSPFITAIPFLLVSGVIISRTWPENYGSKKSDYLKTYIEGLKVIVFDEKILLLGVIQSLFESVMYVFVFLWTPILEPSNLPLGLVFSVFMLCNMMGSMLYQFYSSRNRPAVSTLTSSLLLALVSMVLCTLSTDPDHPRQMLSYLAFLLMEVSVGMYFPSIGFIKSQVIPESHRANVMNWFRVPLNIITCFLLLFLHQEDFAHGNQMLFIIAAFLLGAAVLIVFRLRRLVANFLLIRDILPTSEN